MNVQEFVRKWTENQRSEKAASQSQFNGLSSPVRQKAVTEATGLQRARLDDLAPDGDLDITRVGALLAAMKHESRAIKPAALGVLGKEHLTCLLYTSPSPRDS